jgi:hypothetical protein
MAMGRQEMPLMSDEGTGITPRRRWSALRKAEIVAELRGEHRPVSKGRPSPHSREI